MLSTLILSVLTFSVIALTISQISTAKEIRSLLPEKSEPQLNDEARSDFPQHFESIERTDIAAKMYSESNLNSNKMKQSENNYEAKPETVGNEVKPEADGSEQNAVTPEDNNNSISAKIIQEKDEKRADRNVQPEVKEGPQKVDKTSGSPNSVSLKPSNKLNNDKNTAEIRMLPDSGSMSTTDATELEKNVKNDIQNKKSFKDGVKVDINYNACDEKKCDAVGEECVIDEKTGDAKCECFTKCAFETNPKYQVCSNQNTTFDNECLLQQQACLCSKGQQGCNSLENSKLKLEYIGHCKEFKPCSNFEMEEYPKRMRDWLFVVMKELGSRRTLNNSAMKTLKTAEQHEKRWLLPVIWKFCDLDITNDRQVSYDELLPVSSQLKAYEHCTGPFISNCDVNHNKMISLTEWGECLGLKHDEITDMCTSFKS